MENVRHPKPEMIYYETSDWRILRNSFQTLLLKTCMHVCVCMYICTHIWIEIYTYILCAKVYAQFAIEFIL
jgi:hypothetical protein